MHSLSGGSLWGYLDNTKHLIFWLCNMKQLNFRRFNTNTKKILWNSTFFPERGKNGSIKANIILFSISRSCPPFYDNSGLFQKITEGHRRFPKTVEDFQRRPTVAEDVRKTLQILNFLRKQ